MNDQHKKMTVEQKKTLIRVNMNTVWDRVSTV